MADQSQSAVSLRHYVEILWRRKWTVIVTMILVTGIITLVSFLQPTSYTGVARILVENPSSTLNVATGANLDNATPDDREIQTLASFVVTPEVGARALATLGWKGTPQDYADKIMVEPDIAANVISVVAAQPTADAASKLANAYAQGFVAWRRESQLATVKEALDLVETQLANATPGSLTAQTLQERQRQLDVILALTTGGLQVGEAAQPPLAPSSPRPKRNAALALAAGLLLGVGLAFLRESLDVNLHSADEVGALTTLPLIATIPEFRRDERSPKTLVTLDDPRGPAAEAYRFLRTNLDFVNFNHDQRIVMVTSPLPSQGKSTTVANLAIALLRAGKRVALVEGDLRRPSLHQFFKITNTRGVSSVVSGATPLDEAAQVLTFHDSALSVTTPGVGGAVRHSSVDGVTDDGDLKLLLLPSGPLPPNPGEIVTSQQLADILTTLKKDADYVLVDVPPMFAVGDAAAMAALVDGIIVVLRLEQTTADTVKNVEEFFTRVPAKALGIVVTGVPRSGKGRYSRYQEYYA